MELQNAVVIVTGASSGIGRAVAQILHARGAQVVLAARSAEKLRALEAELPGSLAVPTDMRKSANIIDLIETVREKFGRVDILINNAGQGLRSAVADVDMEDYRTIMELNVFSVVEAMQAVIPIMRKQGRGMILNVSSMVSKNYIPYISAYASTKYALNAISLTARQELAGDGITVSVFYPKMTATDFGANARGQTYDSRAGRPGVSADTPEEVAEAIAEQIETEAAEASM